MILTILLTAWKIFAVIVSVIFVGLAIDELTGHTGNHHDPY